MFDQNTENHVYNFLNQLLSEVLKKMDSVTVTISDVTNQVRSLVDLSSKIPTRQDIVDKIHQLNKSFDESINDKVVENIDECHEKMIALVNTHFGKVDDKLDKKEKDHSDFTNDLKEITRIIKEIQEKQVSIETKLDHTSAVAEEIRSKFKKTIKIILWALFTGVPTLFGLFTLLSKYLVK
jgi:chromosome segregation ATPase